MKLKANEARLLHPTSRFENRISSPFRQKKSFHGEFFLHWPFAQNLHRNGVSFSSTNNLFGKKNVWSDTVSRVKCLVENRYIYRCMLALDRRETITTGFRYLFYDVTKFRTNLSSCMGLLPFYAAPRISPTAASAAD